MINRDIVAGTIVALDGEFDLEQRDRLTGAFDAVAGDSLVIVDLGRAPYIDSTVLSCLVRLRNDVLERGGMLAIAAPQPTVMRLLEIAGLRPLFDIHANLDDVRQQYRLENGALRRIEIVADAFV